MVARSITVSRLRARADSNLIPSSEPSGSHSGEEIQVPESIQLRPPRVGQSYKTTEPSVVIGICA